MEIAITDILEVGQLVKSRVMRDGDEESTAPYEIDQIGVILEIGNATGRIRRGAALPGHHVVKILWQDRGIVENMPDWIAAEVLIPLPS